MSEGKREKEHLAAKEHMPSTYGNSPMCATITEWQLVRFRKVGGYRERRLELQRKQAASRKTLSKIERVLTISQRN